MEKISYIARRRPETNKAQNTKHPKEFAFVVITAFVLFGPTALLCLVLGQVWPLLMIIGSDVLGAGLGMAKFNRPPSAIVSCIPSCATSNPTVSHSVNHQKKAA
jgi:hypothetical protein